ncbi:hypothetical protein SEVIR_4G288900v4 [Setaria viridis]|uniref:Nudix hydrolase domain-containing protein n=1 Tax=Setaria viridis TaxID=4556 RepID=A0A4U6VGS3_SETVI|nr:uncharacterized protein LOC117851644 [Setaria viridis]TKW23387.1 hypothetical protein SEVIR_4G288900v2 [Setaria viridis]
MENSPPPAAATEEAQATQPDPLPPRDPAAMRPPSPPRAPLAFPTLDSLAAFLRPRLPPQALSSWGAVPGTKTLLNLFLELSHGDCTLIAPTAPPPSPQVVRAVHVATVRIRNRRGARLVEARQLLSDGTVRSRGPRPLSEKMRPGESPEAAAARAVREELGERARVRIGVAREEAAAPRVEERESVSYPGLPARYVLHAVDAEVVGGVPEDGAFETEETGEDEGDAGAGAITVKRHYWEWVDDDGDGDDEHKEVAAAGARAH